MPHLETVQFRCDVSAASAPLYHSWEHTVGSGHAPMALRSAWQAQLRQCHDERGFRHVRFHGWLSDEMGTLIRHHDALLYSFFNADQILDFLIAIAPLSHPSSSHVQSHEPEAVYDFAIRDSMLETRIGVWAFENSRTAEELLRCVRLCTHDLDDWLEAERDVRDRPR